jgi:ring-1,2-phenylacetyl-CoA epoxidase subunit PaaC
VSVTAARSAGLVVNPALAVLEPDLRDAYGRLLLFLADSELVIGHRHSEWTGFAPSAEEDVAFSSIAQDEMGHAHLYYALMVGADSEDAVDALALDRGPRQMRHLPLLHAPNGDWFFTIARHVFWDLFEDVLLEAATDSSLPLLAGAAQRVRNEEVYHDEHATQWLQLLSGRGPQRRRFTVQLARVATIAGNPFRAAEGLDQLGIAGLIAPADELAERYSMAIRDRLETAGGWSRGESEPVVAALAANRPGASPPGLFRLHRDLTGLRRAHLGASW